MASSSDSFLSGAVAFNRRADIRYEFDKEKSQTAVKDGFGSTAAVRIVNISKGGMALEADHYIEPSTLLSIVLPSKDKFGSMRLVMRVRTAESASPGLWKIGCVFSRKLNDTELLALM